MSQKNDINDLEKRSHLARPWEKLLKHVFGNGMKTPSSAIILMATPFVMTKGQLLFAWCLAEITLGDHTSHDKKTIGKKDLNIYNMSALTLSRDDSGSSLARGRMRCFSGDR